MKMTHNCIKCGVKLTDKNWYPSGLKKSDYICKNCKNKVHVDWRKANPDKAKLSSIRSHRADGQLPMSENKECPGYLGVYVNERLLKHYFDDVEVMPFGNPGYDFVCGKGKKVDGKSSCLNKRGSWLFNINHNIITDYFLCVAYDNRDDLNPLHIWLIPGDKLNCLMTASISPSTLHKWAEYEKPIDAVITCCNTMKSH